jgi:SAM-dependent methyltransferase
MPSGEVWQRFFDPDCILRKLDCDETRRMVFEFGCGYGLFTEAAARITRGTVHAVDIEPEMVAATLQQVAKSGLVPVHVALRDFVQDGSGQPDQSMDYVMLFNILHIEEPVKLLREAHRILVPDGIAAVIHWNYDATTPRGPSMEIRPRPEQCQEWAEEAGLQFLRHEPLECCSYHYGLVTRRPPAQ